MTHPWFRLWSDMVNDPKWRTIAKASGCGISEVMAVALHMMTAASNAAPRGVLEGFEDEDVAIALDIPTERVVAIRDAMQGRFLDGERLLGWDKRQPKREDGTAAQRMADMRARQEALRTVTPDKKKIREEKKQSKPTPTSPDGLVVPGAAGDLPPDEPTPEVVPPASAVPPCPHQDIIALYHEILPMCTQVRAWSKVRQAQLRARWRAEKEHQSLGFWRTYFGYVASSRFLTGRVTARGDRRPFLADLEWLTVEGNFIHVCEGKYE